MLQEEGTYRLNQTERHSVTVKFHFVFILFISLVAYWLVVFFFLMVASDV